MVNGAQDRLVGWQNLKGLRQDGGGVCAEVEGELLERMRIAKPSETEPIKTDQFRVRIRR